MQMKKALSVMFIAGHAANAKAYTRPPFVKLALANSVASRSMSSRRNALDFPLSRALGASSPLASLDFFNFFDDFDFPSQVVSAQQQHRMALDVKETPEGYELLVDLPGVESKDIDVKLRDRDLIINAHRETTKKEDREQFHRVERRSGRMSRMLTLPENADENSIEAENKNGVLHVKIKKSASEPKIEAKKIEIKQLP